MVRQYSISIEGLTPLLMHSDNIEWADEMDAWKSDPKNRTAGRAGDDRTPAFRWIGSVYNDTQRVCMAADNLSRCLMEGGGMVRAPGRGNKTFKSQTQSGMKVDQAMVPLLVNGSEIPFAPIMELMNEGRFPEHLAAVKRMDFKLLCKRARIGTAKHIRVRPVFYPWELRFSISVWDEQLTTEALKDILNLSGTYKGLCDWRPGGQTPGSYGMFKATDFTIAS